MMMTSVLVSCIYYFHSLCLLVYSDGNGVESSTMMGLIS
uniref:Uncharacterized protein n=1 Tax=Rhizophora mucronata TaxID=61149 RepID=A0A2P2MVM7_RHIMU